LQTELRRLKRTARKFQEKTQELKEKQELLQKLQDERTEYRAEKEQKFPGENIFSLFQALPPFDEDLDISGITTVDELKGRIFPWNDANMEKWQKHRKE